jgi:hypothetical protein
LIISLSFESSALTAIRELDTKTKAIPSSKCPGMAFLFGIFSGL